MKKITVISLLAVFLVSIAFVGVYAQNETESQVPTSEETSPLGEYPVGSFQEIAGQAEIKPGNLLIEALNWVFNIVLIICVIILIYAGFLYASAGGDQLKVKKAMSTLIYALIGIAIALGAQALINLVTGFFGAEEIHVGQTIEQQR
ncbi:MAG: hypothetical protein AB7D02_03100 [Candidatus Paceibacterota bacterium]|jgi:hypothetical protein|nr:hypothetical protein [Candidatus Paceibacterota bacterium]